LSGTLRAVLLGVKHGTQGWVLLDLTLRGEKTAPVAASVNDTGDGSGEEPFLPLQSGVTFTPQDESLSPRPDGT
jgi:hypothetical protein